MKRKRKLGKPVKRLAYVEVVAQAVDELGSQSRLRIINTVDERVSNRLCYQVYRQVSSQVRIQALRKAREP